MNDIDRFNQEQRRRRQRDHTGLLILTAFVFAALLLYAGH